MGKFVTTTVLVSSILAGGTAFLIEATVQAQVQPKRTEAPVLQPLEADKDFVSGCGCSVTNREEETLVFSEPEEKSPAIVKIGGQKMTLKFKSSNEKSETAKKGD